MTTSLLQHAPAGQGLTRPLFPGCVEQGFLMVKSERKTENVVRDELRRLGYYKGDSGIVVEEQRSEVEAVKKLMRAASKAGGGGVGSPEFIISSPKAADFLVVIECKADPHDHISDACKIALANGCEGEENEEEYAKRVQQYAVDGALHYASRLSKEYNVVAVAVSGESLESVVISTCLYPKGAKKTKPLRTKDGAAIDKIIGWEDYVQHGTFDPAVQRLRADELMAFSRELHDFMRDFAKLTESEKPLLVSGTLIALRNKPFAASFDAYAPAELQDAWLRVISEEVHKADIPKAKKEKWCSPIRESRRILSWENPPGRIRKASCTS